MSSVDKQAIIQQCNNGMVSFPATEALLVPSSARLARVGPKVEWIRNWASCCSSGEADTYGVVVVVVLHWE